MSVIAKLDIRNVTDFGTGRLIELGCVCENDLMAAYAGSEENRLFTRYSPWGEMKLHQPEGFILGNGKTSDGYSRAAAFYVMALHESEHTYVEDDHTAFGRADKNFPGSAAWIFGHCYSVTDFGGSKHVEFRANNGGTYKGRAIEKLNWKMQVDNPGASDQFKPGHNYYFVLYSVEHTDRDGAIASAHGR